MLAGLKSKLALNTFTGSHNGSPDGGNVNSVPMRAADAAVAARIATGPAVAKAAPVSAAAAANAARAAAAEQLGRLQALRDAVLVRVTSAVEATRAAVGGLGAGARPPDVAPLPNPPSATSMSANGASAISANCSISNSFSSTSNSNIVHDAVSDPTVLAPAASGTSRTKAAAAALTAAARRIRGRAAAAAAAITSGSGRGSGGPPSLPPEARQRPQSQAASREHRGATHLIVLANGLFGSPGNWEVICEQLRAHLDMPTVVLHPSQVNRFTDTYDGIDVCGQRLADEIRSVAAAHPSLQRISVIGHSMGGLLLRYALGLLYNPSTGRIAGLRPAHFVTLATPHCGCDAEGLAQVPFIGWVPVKPVQKMLQVLSVPTAGLMFRRTGRQFFLADGAAGLARAASAAGSAPTAAAGEAAATAAGRMGGFGAVITGRSLTTSVSGAAVATTATAVVATAMPGRTTSGPSVLPAAAAASPSPTGASAASAPLLFRMTQDDPARGTYFYSALASFTSRTAYANTDGDHLVGWANSSLRLLHQLPSLPGEASRARGVIMQDPLLAAFDLRHSPDPGPQSATGPADVPIDSPPAGTPDWGAEAGYGDWGSSASGAAAREAGSRSSSSGGGGDGGNGSAAKGRSLSAVAAEAGENGGGGSRGGPSAVETAAMAEVMLRRLQRLPWRRIDVSFRGAMFGFAHNNIQVTRRWLNFEGMEVASHVARQVAELEAEWQRREAAAGGRAGIWAEGGGTAGEGRGGNVVLKRAPASASVAPPLVDAGVSAAPPHGEIRTQVVLLLGAEVPEGERGVGAAKAEAGLDGTGDPVSAAKANTN